MSVSWRRRWLVMRALLCLSLCLPLQADPLAEFARGVLEESRGNDGSEWFDRAFEQDPEAWPLVQRKAARLFEEGDVAGASTLYREFSERHPERLEVQVSYADFLRNSSPGDDFAAKLAGEVLEGALERHGDSLPVIRRLFRSYEQRGMRENSIDLFEKVAAGEGSGSALAAAEMARTLFAGDDVEARAKIDQVYQQALERAPGDAVLARAASEHFRRSGRLKDAVAVLEKHTTAAPASLELRIRLGILLFAAKREDEGEACLKAVLEIDPRQALAHQTLAKFYRRQDDVERARPHAVQVLKIRGGDADEFLELADELMALERPRDARLLLEKGIFDHPEDPDIAVKLAVATQKDERTRDQAAWRFREAESLSGVDGPATEPSFQLAFSEHLLASGETEAAEARLRAAIKAYPPEAKVETAAALRRLAGIWLEEGRNESAARSLLNRADGLDPQGN